MSDRAALARPRCAPSQPRDESNFAVDPLRLPDLNYLYANDFALAQNPCCSHRGTIDGASIAEIRVGFALLLSRPGCRVSRRIMNSTDRATLMNDCQGESAVKEESIGMDLSRFKRTFNEFVFGHEREACQFSSTVLESPRTEEY